MNLHPPQDPPEKAVDSAILTRRSVRKFLPDDISADTVRELLELSHRAPSGFNMQPWHFVVVRDPEVRKLMCHVAMDQPQVTEAPVTVVFVADPYAWQTEYEKVLALGEESGSLNAARITKYRTTVGTLFSTGPLGLFGLLKRIFVPLRRLQSPLPNVITSHADRVAYVRSHTMLAVATFMIAARARGLDTCPMEGFDEGRLKKLLDIPASMIVPAMVPLGYAADAEEVIPSVRVPLYERLHLEKFS